MEESIGTKGFNFIKENATVDGNNARLTQKQYTEFMNSCGISKEILDTKIAADQELINGMYKFSDEMLSKQVKNSKEPEKEEFECIVNIPNGNIDLTLTASKKYPIPNGGGKTVTKCNVAHLNIKQTRMLDKNLLETCEQQMAKLLNLDI